MVIGKVVLTLMHPQKLNKFTKTHQHHRNQTTDLIPTVGGELLVTINAELSVAKQAIQRAMRAELKRNQTRYQVV